MILQALYELAQREGLVDDPDFEWKPVSYVIHLAASGRFLGLVDTRMEMPVSEGKTKRLPRAKDFRVPRRLPSRSGKTPPPEFLVDNPLYVFGVPPKGKDISPAAAAERARSFRDLVAQCADATQDPGVAAVRDFLDNYRQGSHPVGLSPAEISELPSNEVFAFAYATDGGDLVTNRPAVERWWRQRRSTTGGARTQTCLVTGRHEPVADKHPKIKGLPGGQPSGTAIVSCNANAFESYGWKANENAPVSNAAAEACAAALNRLLHPAPPDPAHPGQTLPRRNIQLTSDTVVCYWASDNSAESLLNSFGDLLGANPENVAEAYRSIWRGEPPPIVDESRFFALTISGVQGRAVVRNWLEASLAEVAAHISQHFADLQIDPITRPAKGKSLPPALPMGLLLESVSPPGKQSEVPPPLASELFESAIQGTPYRVNILLRAIERTRAEIGGLENDDKLKGYQACRRLDARAALIKAYLNRHKRFHPDTSHYQEILPMLDPSNHDPGYLLGQLMAVLERAQQLAMNANATVVDRYFSGASASPRSVFVRLLKNSQHHLRKADDDPKTAAASFLLKRLIDQIADRFDPKANGFPARLDIEQQGMFVLGYHQMRRWLWLNAAERSEWEAQFPEAPAAYRWSKSNDS